MGTGMYTAVSGIDANQTALNVISNNIANISTVSFKSSQADFQTLFSQTYSAGTTPTGNVGGTNPEQVGDGVALGDITQNFSQGGSQFTGRDTDFMIQGNGFFTVLEPNVATAGAGSGAGAYYLTRAGNFTLDGSGDLVTADGNKVLGTATVNGDNPLTVTPVNIPNSFALFKEYNASNQVLHTWIGVKGVSAMPAPMFGGTVQEQDVTLQNFSLGVEGNVTATYSNGDRITVRTDPTSTNQREVMDLTSDGSTFSTSGSGTTGTVTVLNAALTPQQFQLRMAIVGNPSGLLSEGSNNFGIAPNAGTVNLGIGSSNGVGQITGGALESSNVDVAKEFTNMMIAQRAIEANGKVVTTQSQVIQTLIGLVQ